MPFLRSAAVLSAAALLTELSTAQLLSFCLDNKCGNCPVAPGQAVGYPLCNIYDSSTVLGNNGFNGTTGGSVQSHFRTIRAMLILNFYRGFQTWIDVPQPDKGCTVLIRSPAGVNEENCGVPVGSFSTGTCANVPLKETFMMQYCCGSGDCTAAGVARRRGNGWAFERRGGGSGFKFYDANGNIIVSNSSGLLNSATQKIMASIG